MRRLKFIPLLLIAVFMLTMMTGCMNTPNSGEVSVVRNGKAWYWPPDWFDNHQIRGVIANGSGNSWTGLGSTVHPYPVSTQQRFFRMESGSDGNKTSTADAPAVTVPTSDGVEVTIPGTFYFYTAFDGTKRGDDLVKAFDTQFGTRTFNGHHVWAGQSGFSAWLDVIVQPVVANNLRSSISGVTCAELVSSCALVQNNSANASSKTSQLAAGKANQSNIDKIQNDVAQQLKSDLAGTLGRDYFKDIKFQVAGAQLPSQIQNSINDAQSAFAQVTQAQARIQSAKADATANKQRESGYEQCPACATIDALKAIPSSVTTFAPGSGFAITPGGK